MASKNDFKALIRTATEQGWVVEKGRSGHLKWRSPQGQTVFSASTPSDKRALANHLALMRRHGLSA